MTPTGAYLLYAGIHVRYLRVVSSMRLEFARLCNSGADIDCKLQAAPLHGSTALTTRKICGRRRLDAAR